MTVQIPGVEINLTNNSVGISAGRARSGGLEVQTVGRIVYAGIC